jgi:hypothetical protein
MDFPWEQVFFMGHGYHSLDGTLYEIILKFLILEVCYAFAASIFVKSPLLQKFKLIKNTECIHLINFFNTVIITFVLKHSLSLSLFKVDQPSL